MQQGTKTRRRHDRGPVRDAEMCAHFNASFPVGSTVWYWQSIPFGPVLETTVRAPATLVEPGYSNAGMAVAFLDGVAGYVFVCHVTDVLEPQRPYVTFAKIAEMRQE